MLRAALLACLLLGSACDPKPAPIPAPATGTDICDLPCVGEDCAKENCDRDGLMFGPTGAG